MKVEKLKRNFWMTSEIECMLNLIRDVQNSQRTTATTHYTFVQIANKMKKRGFPNKSPTQIRRKWFQMKSAYLCFKRGNEDRLLLIPEQFRPIIAEFVEAEFKNGKIFSPMTKSPKVEEEEVVVLKEKVEKKVPTHKPFRSFFTRLKITHRILEQNIKSKQASLQQFEHNCQRIRDANLINFINENNVLSFLENQV